MMTQPSVRYQKAVATGIIQDDPGQQVVLCYLNTLYDQLSSKTKSFTNLARSVIGKSKLETKGIYLWGGVGIGKTYLMDLFFESLQTKRKLRLHLHHFMRVIHQELKALQGTQDPLKKIAKKLKANYDVLCFDEFVVSDIADAMLLGGLFEAFYTRGLVTVMTSNLPPERLYHEGLQRGRFLPTIDFILKHNTVLHIPSNHDYRQATLEKVGVYYTPLSSDTDRKFEQCFQALARTSQWGIEPLIINDRSIPVVRVATDLVWFDFDVICNMPRSKLDYIEIAEDFSTVMVSNVPALKPEQEDRASYLIHLVDVFYDAKVRLILSADTSIEALYPSGRLSFQFQRTKSRLQEMQTSAYWHQVHGV